MICSFGKGFNIWTVFVYGWVLVVERIKCNWLLWKLCFCNKSNLASVNASFDIVIITFLLFSFMSLVLKDEYLISSIILYYIISYVHLLCLRNSLISLFSTDVAISTISHCIHLSITPINMLCHITTNI